MEGLQNVFAIHPDTQSSSENFDFRKAAACKVSLDAVAIGSDGDKALRILLQVPPPLVILFEQEVGQLFHLIIFYYICSRIVSHPHREIAA